MKREESRDGGCSGSSRKKFWYIVGGAAVSLVAYTVLVSLHDIRRYWNMRRM